MGDVWFVYKDVLGYGYEISYHNGLITTVAYSTDPKYKTICTYRITNGSPKYSGYIGSNGNHKYRV